MTDPNVIARLLHPLIPSARCPFIAASLLFSLSAPLWAANSSLIQSPLANTGVDTDAAGKVHSSLTEKRSELIVTVSKLDPRAVYRIEVGGILEGTFTTNRSGAATVRFRGPKAGRDLALDFDPRGKEMRILKAGTTDSVLQVTVSANAAAESSIGVERVDQKAAPGIKGKASAEFRKERKGRRTFNVDLSRVKPGAAEAELYVDGTKRGTFPKNGTLSRVRFAAPTTNPAVPLLDFDPLGAIVEVVQDGAVIFSSEMAAVAQGVNVASPRLSKVLIPSTGADPDGQAEAKQIIDARARKHFSVELENVPDGTYDLFVDESRAAGIVVSTGAEGSKGEVEFTTGGDDPTDLPLTFDPAGKTLKVSRDGTVFFQGVFTPDTDNGAGTPKPEPASRSEESLTSTGLDADGFATAEYRVDEKGRHKFNVELVNLPVGSYSVLAAGTVRGSISVTSVGLASEIEFTSNVEPGKRRLNFDPRGQLLEITSPEGTFFSHLLGSASTGLSWKDDSGRDRDDSRRYKSGRGTDDKGGDDKGGDDKGGDDKGGDDKGGDDKGGDDKGGDDKGRR
jgi:hypothetical protein